MKYQRDEYLKPAFDDLMQKDCPLICDYIANLEMQIENLYNLRQSDMEMIDSLKAITSPESQSLIDDYERLKTLVKLMYSHIIESVANPSNELMMIMNEAYLSATASEPRC